MPTRTILLTRSKQDSEPLQRALEQKGFQVWVEPVFTFCFQSADMLYQALKNISPEDLLFFMSPRAVAALDELKPTLQALQGLLENEVFAVGSSTAEALLGLGFQHIHCPGRGDENSEGVLALLPTFPLPHQRAFIFRGETGRELLAETLRQQGVAVSYVACYQTIPRQTAIKLPAPPDLIVVASYESLRMLSCCVDRAYWLHATVTVLNQNMLDCCHKLGVKHTLWLNSAHNDEIIQTIEEDHND